MSWVKGSPQSHKVLVLGTIEVIGGLFFFSTWGYLTLSRKSQYRYHAKESRVTGDESDLHCSNRPLLRFVASLRVCKSIMY